MSDHLQMKIAVTAGLKRTLLYTETFFNVCTYSLRVQEIFNYRNIKRIKLKAH